MKKIVFALFAFMMLFASCNMNGSDAVEEEQKKEEEVAKITDLLKCFRLKDSSITVCNKEGKALYVEDKVLAGNKVTLKYSLQLEEGKTVNDYVYDEVAVADSLKDMVMNGVLYDAKGSMVCYFSSSAEKDKFKDKIAVNAVDKMNPVVTVDFSDLVFDMLKIGNMSMTVCKAVPYGYWGKDLNSIKKSTLTIGQFLSRAEGVFFPKKKFMYDAELGEKFAKYYEENMEEVVTPGTSYMTFRPYKGIRWVKENISEEDIKNSAIYTKKEYTAEELNKIGSIIFDRADYVYNADDIMYMGYGYEISESSKFITVSELLSLKPALDVRHDGDLYFSNILDRYYYKGYFNRNSNVLAMMGSFDNPTPDDKYNYLSYITGSDYDPELNTRISFITNEIDNLPTDFECKNYTVSERLYYSMAEKLADSRIKVYKVNDDDMSITVYGSGKVDPMNLLFFSSDVEGKNNLYTSTAVYTKTCSYTDDRALKKYKAFDEKTCVYLDMKEKVR